MLIAISESRRLRRNSVRYPVNAGLAGLGVNTHIHNGGIYSTANIINDLAYVGIKNIRAFPPQY